MDKFTDKEVTENKKRKIRTTPKIITNDMKKKKNHKKELVNNNKAKFSLTSQTCSSIIYCKKIYYGYWRY